VPQADCRGDAQAPAFVLWCPPDAERPRGAGVFGGRPASRLLPDGRGAQEPSRDVTLAARALVRVPSRLRAPWQTVSNRAKKQSFLLGCKCFGQKSYLTLWRSNRRRGKSPFAIESIDDRYWHSPRDVTPSRPAQLALIYEWQRGASRRYSPPLWKLYVPAIGTFRPALRSMVSAVADFIE
jgi:hypothetical protein